MTTKPKCGSGYCRLQSTDEGVESCPTDKNGECKYRESVIERYCGNCRNKTVHYDCHCKRNEKHQPEFANLPDEWKPDFNYLEKENAELKSQLARLSQHSFDPEKMETWPPIGELVIVCDNHDKIWPGKWNREHLRWVSQDDYLSTFIGVKWWSYLPGEEG